MVKKIIIFFIFLLTVYFFTPSISRSQTDFPDLPSLDMINLTQATQEASLEAKLLSSRSAQLSQVEIEQKIQEKQDTDITQATGKKKDELAAYLEDNLTKPLRVTNFLRYMIKKAINNGLPANIIVLILLFPLLASIIAASRHIIGLKGFGIYTPAVLSIAFASTGYSAGIAIFLIIILATLFFKKAFHKIKSPYLPKTALLLWGVSLTILGCFLITSILQLTEMFLNISIFPLLIIILLSENFIETQLFASQKEAFRLTFDTLLLATICYLFITATFVQKFVIINPELMIILTAIIDIIIGKYKGLRLLEYNRFKQLIKK